MRHRIWLGAVFSCVILAQPPKFASVELRASGPNTILRMRNRFAHGRYEFGNATMVDLIRTAWNVDGDAVVGGPDWLDADRFDVIANAPADSTPEALKTMLRAMLADRFQLKVHNGMKDVPAYAMTASSKPQLKQSDGSGDAGCTTVRRPPRDPWVFTCRGMTMAAFADRIPVLVSGGYGLPFRVVDQTGLSGSWDFNLTWSPRVSRDTVSFLDTIENQLGLKLRPAKVSMPVLVVDSAKKPAIEKPPARRLEFEVATIKPDEPDRTGSYVSVPPGGHVRIMMTLQDLIWEAWGNLYTDRIIGGPKSMDSARWVVEAKAPSGEDAQVGWNGANLDLNSMRMMLRALLVDRFKLDAHMEDRLVSGYALVATGAAKTKLRRADPANRAGCKDGPGADGKDPRFTNPMASRLVTCRNMTLAQFAAELSKPTSEESLILGSFPPVVDATGISGRFDMTINFTPPGAIQNGASTPAGGGAIASDPDGTISIFEALEKQLGLKLESRKVMGQVLVISHVNETPTDN